MKLQLYQVRLKDLLAQRNGMLVLSALLLGLNILQALTLWGKKERLVLVPPELSQKVWVEHNKASSSYYEETALFLAHFILDVTPTSAPYQHQVVLRYVAPEKFSPLKAQLLEEVKRLEKESLSTTFKPLEVKVNPDHGLVELTGELSGYVGDKKVSTTWQTYRLQFHFHHGQLQLTSFQCIGEKKR